MPIVIDQVSFQYDSKRIIEDVTMEVHDGTTHVVTGCVGSGKTTLALLIVGILKPSRGRILVDGIDPSSHTFPRQHLQLAFQFPEEQMFESTVCGELGYALRNFGMKPDEIEDRIRWALSATGLGEGFLGREIRTLSFGERRRVALASVIAIRPKYLLLDEPFAGLDWSGIESLIETLKNLKSQGMTIVVFTHEADLIGEFGDFVSLLEHGRVAFTVSSKDFLKQSQALDRGLAPVCAMLGRYLAMRGQEIDLEDLSCKSIIAKLKGIG